MYTGLLSIATTRTDSGLLGTRSLAGVAVFPLKVLHITDTCLTRLDEALVESEADSDKSARLKPQASSLMQMPPFS